MAKIIQFIPKAEKVAKQHLADFITHYIERLTVFDENLDQVNPTQYKVVNFTKLGAHSRP